MKTRSEMVYDFMVALAAGVDGALGEDCAKAIRQRAERLADAYLNFISGAN